MSHICQQKQQRAVKNSIHIFFTKAGGKLFCKMCSIAVEHKRKQSTYKHNHRKTYTESGRNAWRTSDETDHCDTGCCILEVLFNDSAIFLNIYIYLTSTFANFTYSHNLIAKKCPTTLQVAVFRKTTTKAGILGHNNHRKRVNREIDHQTNPESLEILFIMLTATFWCISATGNSDYGKYFDFSALSLKCIISCFQIMYEIMHLSQSVSITNCVTAFTDVVMNQELPGQKLQTEITSKKRLIDDYSPVSTQLGNQIMCFLSVRVTS